ncbi:Cu(I)-responsive transcriptional regulator [Oceaniovalibus sp. ACAM 378]|uniref:Cu(I)-responsive transcriptional regulator n=1 Tax=Oceaniovalibus sp. ACAM 378 TaxID=2599923 RepID=UPI0011D844CC|nr:Cu(I)-responsive transcriptional regulator [Oceaniovalibus sp. ACAM 378]TYB90753.1 Cu(I)-responsive transcriptional regulator [Oceaniovalibus sp. ACAM 378]
MNIGEVSKRAKLPAKTIRYYEEIGLILPQREPNGYRVFRASELHKLEFVGRARAMGFSIEECRTLLALWDDRNRASADVRALAARHLAVIEARMDDLRAMHATLSDLVTACAGDDRPDCPILSTLAADGAPPDREL